jgi:hypothetical protein
VVATEQVQDILVVGGREDPRLEGGLPAAAEPAGELEDAERVAVDDIGQRAGGGLGSGGVVERQARRDDAWFSKNVKVSLSRPSRITAITAAIPPSIRRERERSSRSCLSA